MEEQDVYKKVLTNLIDKTENFQIEDSKEFVQTLIKELNHHDVIKSSNA